MKKVSLKNEISGMLESAEEVYWTGKTTDLEVKSGNFTGWYTVKTGDESSRQQMEEFLRKQAEQVNRQLRHFPAYELNARSNNFQKAMAYIGEHRHLIPFLRYIDDYIRSHPGKSESDAIRDYKKKNQLPPELHHEGYGIYSFGPKLPHISVFVEQLPYLPKAWVL